MEDAIDIVEKLKQTPAFERTYSQYLAVSDALKEVASNQVTWPVFRMAILRNFTVEPLLPVLEGELVAAGFYPEIYLGDFDAIAQDALDSKSALYTFKPDMIVVTTWLETLSPSLTSSFLRHSPEKITDEKDRIRKYLKDIIRTVRNNSSAPILINNFVPPVEPTLGILDSQMPNGQFNEVVRLNQELLSDSKSTSDVYVLDLARLFTAYGTLNSFDAKHWQMARAPLSAKVMGAVGREVVKFVGALRGKAKKCLVIDCDNTLWGGVVGEDGLSGIKLGPTFPGSSYVALQEEILNLHDRGVILTLCSKNNEKDVLEVLRKHPDMLIKEAHLASWRINWLDKVSNIRSLAEELNIGLDSFVLIDDSDFEINHVREQLPQVATIHLKGNTADYRRELNKVGLFDSLTVTSEDRRRNAMYGENRQRKEIEASSDSMDAYLQKLGIEVNIGAAGEFDIQRVSQLTQKTNQFNLTTRRYSEGQIRELIVDSKSDVYCIKVRDKISDLGLVGVVIVRCQDDGQFIDSFLLSCRALGRGVEVAMLSAVVNQNIRQTGKPLVYGQFLATEKNAQAQDFYSKNKFECVSEDEKSGLWVFDACKKALDLPSWLKVTFGDKSEQK